MAEVGHCEKTRPPLRDAYQVAVGGLQLGARRNGEHGMFEHRKGPQEGIIVWIVVAIELGYTRTARYFRSLSSRWTRRGFNETWTVRPQSTRHTGNESKSM